MEIVAVFDGHEWRVSPDPAEVVLGSPITWILRTSGAPLPHLRWIVYFDHGSPFGAGHEHFAVTTHGTPAGGPVGTRHEGRVGPVYANESGDYKYGVRVDEPTTGMTLGDDDPRLIVRP